MPDFTTNRNSCAPRVRGSDQNHEFIPEAAERLDDNVPREEITRRVTELVLAHDPVQFYTSDASEDEKKSLLSEAVNRFKQPFAIWWVSIVNALAATVQGMDETVISGAQLYFLKYFGLEDNALLTGLINASPYLMCATVGCWLAIPSNHFLGRRGTVFLWSLVSIGASTWQAVSTSWQSFLGSRLLLGVCIGANSATVAVYTAECAPASIRGGLVMMWQVFVSFGIMMGYIISAAFVHVHYPLNWRLMIGSQLVAPIFVIATVYFGPESPRYLVSRQRYAAAFRSLLRLRATRLQASRDLYYIVQSVKLEEDLRSGRTLFSDIRDVVQHPRVRYAALASWFIMFMQNFCGINAMTYYTGQVFVDTGATAVTAIYASIGAGALLFIGALPAIKYIDIWGRRPLLIWSLVSMGACTLWTGLSFLASDPKTRLVMVAIGIYLYEATYAPGQGVVPFVYASEAFPLYMRTLGMSFSTATTWTFSFALTFAWPSQLNAMTSTGAFCWYSAWCFVGATLAYFFIPETRGKSLEELDMVFAVPISIHGANKLHQLRYRLGLSSDRPRDMEDIIRENAFRLSASRGVNDEEKMGEDIKQVEHLEHKSAL
ncbi:hypothetical protein BDV38DRAFT_283948 [Aspergillus pseudotamarii]|uniref:Major facilitator superfamily (MFS) profile domain-containing protein n=1 Tax=Aspergillus pseudotamarii TaxID=132259 RepID=A0A5N6SRQ8_ASPPS|nr:uncharacterized protein BDV38DRAFT_283948 [Aspergillus pseudotamarii]KAE8136461.1 hypothetical protein BDV38DRAFT_283948 [Aspergillus pseudotamarii]